MVTGWHFPGYDFYWQKKFRISEKSSVKCTTIKVQNFPTKRLIFFLYNFSVTYNRLKVLNKHPLIWFHMYRHQSKASFKKKEKKSLKRREKVSCQNYWFTGFPEVKKQLCKFSTQIPKYHKYHDNFGIT